MPCSISAVATWTIDKGCNSFVATLPLQFFSIADGSQRKVSFKYHSFALLWNISLVIRLHVGSPTVNIPNEAWHDDKRIAQVGFESLIICAFSSWTVSLCTTQLGLHMEEAARMGFLMDVNALPQLVLHIKTNGGVSSQLSYHTCYIHVPFRRTEMTHLWSSNGGCSCSFSVTNRTENVLRPLFVASTSPTESKLASNIRWSNGDFK